MLSVPGRVVVIDDDRVFAMIVSRAAEASGYAVEVLHTGIDLESASTLMASVIILDLVMPRCDGIEVLQLLARLRCTAHIVLVSGHDEKVLAAAQKLGIALGLNIVSHLVKPVSPERLKQLLSELRTRPLPT